MITIIRNSEKQLEFNIGSFYRVSISKRTKFCSVYLLPLDVDLMEVLLSVHLSSLNIKKLPLIMDYLKKISTIMTGEHVANRLLRMFLLAVDNR